jgi:hypothetical protein
MIVLLASSLGQWRCTQLRNVRRQGAQSWPTLVGRHAPGVNISYLALCPAGAATAPAFLLLHAGCC